MVTFIEEILNGKFHFLRSDLWLAATLLKVALLEGYIALPQRMLQYSPKTHFVLQIFRSHLGSFFCAIIAKNNSQQITLRKQEVCFTFPIIFFRAT